MVYYVNNYLEKDGNSLILSEINLELANEVVNLLMENRGEVISATELNLDPADIELLIDYGFLSRHENYYNLVPNLGYSIFGLDSRCLLEDFHLPEDKVGLFEVPYYSGMFKHDHSVKSMSILKEASYKTQNPNYSNWFSSKTTKSDIKQLEIADYGFLRMAEKEIMEKEIMSLSSKVFSKNASTIYPLFIGGDHAITYPIIKGYKLETGDKKLRVVYFDAHSDFSDGSTPLSHGNVFSKIHQLNNVEIINLGIRGPITEAETDKLKMITIFNEVSNLLDYLKKDINMPTYLSIDIDVFDPSIMPGVTFPVPDGIQFSEFNSFIKNVIEEEINIIGADIVEYNASNDINEIGAIHTSNVIYQVLKMLSNQRS